MKKILVPVDYTPASEAAAEYAVSFASSINCEIVLFHAMQVPVPTSEIPPVYFTGPELEIENREKIQGYAKALKEKFPDASIRSEIRYDFVKDGISEMAKTTSEFRMIFMGITPAGGFMQMFPGGTAVNLINEINIPLVIVPGDAKYKQVKRIVAAVDTEAIDLMKQGKPLRDLTLLSGSEIVFAHIIEKDEQLTEARKDKFRSQIEGAFKGLTPSIVFQSGPDLYKGLEEVAESQNADMLVMFHHKRGFLKSLFSIEHTRKYAYMTRIPLVVLPLD